MMYNELTGQKKKTVENHFKNRADQYWEEDLNDHAIGRDGIKSLISGLRDPIAVISSDSFNDTVIAVVEFEINNKKTIAAVQFDYKGTISGNGIDANKLNCAYGKRKLKSLVNKAIDYEKSKSSIGGILYVNKKKARSNANSVGLQLPQILSNGLNPRLIGKNAIVKSKFNSQTETIQLMITLLFHHENNTHTLSHFHKRSPRSLGTT